MAKNNIDTESGGTMENLNSTDSVPAPMSTSIIKPESCMQTNASARGARLDMVKDFRRFESTALGASLSELIEDAIKAGKVDFRLTGSHTENTEIFECTQEAAVLGALQSVVGTILN